MSVEHALDIFRMISLDEKLVVLTTNTPLPQLYRYRNVAAINMSNAITETLVLKYPLDSKDHKSYHYIIGDGDKYIKYHYQELYPSSSEFRRIDDLLTHIHGGKISSLSIPKPYPVRLLAMCHLNIDKIGSITRDHPDMMDRVKIFRYIDGVFRTGLGEYLIRLGWKYIKDSWTISVTHYSEKYNRLLRSYRLLKDIEKTDTIKDFLNRLERTECRKTIDEICLSGRILTFQGAEDIRKYLNGHSS